MSSAIAREAAALILRERWAALATVEHGEPAASMVAYAVEGPLEALVLLLSGLAAHTQQLLAHRAASLVVSVPDTGEGDPQLLARVSLRVRAAEAPRGSDESASAGVAYARRFPDSLPRFELPDFRLFRLTIDEARCVGGFARAASFDGAALREAAAALATSGPPSGASRGEAPAR